MKVLFVEPFGHREGHPSFESRRETGALVEAGAEITLVTFMGVKGDWAAKEGRVAHVGLFPPAESLVRVYDVLNRSSIVRSLLRMLETFLTLSLVVWLNRKRTYDVVHVFDSEPVFFFSLPFSLLLRADNVIVTVYNPPLPHENWRSNLREFMRHKRLNTLLHMLWYELGESRLGSKARAGLYRLALRRSSIQLICHTTQLVQAYEEYMDGAFSGLLNCIPLGVESSGDPVSRAEARQKLGLPDDGRKLFLMFGNNHPGKDLGVIFHALAGIQTDFIILQAGKLGVGPESGDPLRLAKKYGLQNQVIVRDVFIPEIEKVLYFRAADAAILSYRDGFIQSASIINDTAKFSTPVIATQVGQLGDFATTYELGVTFIPSDHQSLRQAIETFLDFSQDDIARIEANCARFQSDFSWGDNARKHLEVYSRSRNPRGSPDARSISR